MRKFKRKNNALRCSSLKFCTEVCAFAVQNAGGNLGVRHRPAGSFNMHWKALCWNNRISSCLKIQFARIKSSVESRELRFIFGTWWNAIAGQTEGCGANVYVWSFNFMCLFSSFLTFEKLIMNVLNFLRVLSLNTNKNLKFRLKVSYLDSNRTRSPFKGVLIKYLTGIRRFSLSGQFVYRILWTST